MRVKFFTFLLLVTAFSLGIFGQALAPGSTADGGSDSKKTQFFPLSELREGMRGTARTVFHGLEPEEFSVEILGIIPGAIGPNQDLIVGRLSGGSTERTAVFAGMSGSPVYIDGKLVGAIAYSFAFSKEPICGITPIDQMIEIFEEGEPLGSINRQPAKFSLSDLAATDPASNYRLNPAAPATIFAGLGVNGPIAAIGGQSFQPIATPISFTGFSPQTLRFFERELIAAGLLPVASVGGSAPITPLKAADENTLLGGDSVMMQLTRGDYSMAAAGTVTYRDGDKIYAFGHPFLSLGTSDLPMSESRVITVIPSLNNSFKLSVPGDLVGSMTQDRAIGVFGRLGQVPKLIPVTINLLTSRNQHKTLNLEVVRDESLTALLVNISIFNAIISNERGMGESTVSINAEINLRDKPPIVVNNRFAGPMSPQMASFSVALPVNALFTSRFDEMEITSINLDLRSTDGSNTASLERIALDRTQVKPGETVQVQAFVRADTGHTFSLKIPVKIPLDTPAGEIMIVVGDGNAIQQNSVANQFVPKDLFELIKTINELKRPDLLYAQAYRVTNGAVIGSTELPNLPPSVLATMNNDRTAGGFSPTLQTVLTEQELEPAEFIISGRQSLSVEVVR